MADNITPDGKWRWNGETWEPNLPPEAATMPTEAAPEPVAPPPEPQPPAAEQAAPEAGEPGAAESPTASEEPIAEPEPAAPMAAGYLEPPHLPPPVSAEPARKVPVLAVVSILVAVAVVGLGLAFLVRGSQSEDSAAKLDVATPASTPTTPTSSPTDDRDDYDWSGSTADDSDYEDYSYTPTYTCKNIREDVTDMALEQHTWGSLLVGIKDYKVDVDRQRNPPANNGWLLRCKGTGVVSGGSDQSITYGIVIQSGETDIKYQAN